MLTFLQGCEGLHDLPASARAALAGGLRLVRYPAGALLTADPRQADQAPLRIVVQGALLLRAAAQPDPLDLPLVGPGALTGLASVARWAQAAGRGTALPHSGFTAECQEPLAVLELPLDRYAAVLADTDLCARLLALHGASAHRSLILRAIQRDPGLCALPPVVQARLCRAARLEMQPAVPGLRVPIRPTQDALLPAAEVEAVRATCPRLARAQGALLLTVVRRHPAVRRAVPLAPLAAALEALGDTAEIRTLPPAVCTPEAVQAQLRVWRAEVAVAGQRHLLVDATAAALPRGWAEVGLTGLGGPVQVSYLIDQPENWWAHPDVEGLTPASVPVLPVARPGDPLEVSVRAGRLEARLGAARQALGGTGPSPWALHGVRPDPDPARWARAVSHRRVGLAIGGAGAQSYAAIPLLRRLAEAGIPVDAVAGTSTGAFVGVFYAVAGEAGLEQMVRRWYGFSLGVMASWWGSNLPFEAWLVRCARYLDLNDLPMPVIAACTRAGTGEAVYLTAGSAGLACLASGALPPMQPAFVRGERLLDGAPSDEVPVGVLAAAGCDLLLAVQCVPRVAARRPQAPVAATPGIWLRASPGRRALDFVRSYILLVRQSARGALAAADVVYEATTPHTHAGSFWSSRRIVRDAAQSAALDAAVAATEALWRRHTTPLSTAGA